MLVLFANLELALATGALIVVLVAGAFALFWAKHWHRSALGRTPAPTDDLGSFRALYERGQLTRVEFDSIVLTLAQRARDQAQAQAEDYT